MRGLTLGSRKYIPFLAVAGLLVATAAAVGISNLTAGHSGHLGATAARADSGDGDGGDSDGGPQGPWVSYYAKESSGRPITMAQLHQAAQQAAAIPAPDKTPWQPIGPTNIGGRVVDLVVDPRRPRDPLRRDVRRRHLEEHRRGHDVHAGWPASYTQTMGSIARAPTARCGWAPARPTRPAAASPSRHRPLQVDRRREDLELRRAGDSAAIGRIAVNPHNSNEIWVAASGSIYDRHYTQTGLYHSTDGGQTWTLVDRADQLHDGRDRRRRRPAQPEHRVGGDVGPPSRQRRAHVRRRGLRPLPHRPTTAPPGRGCRTSPRRCPAMTVPRPGWPRTRALAGSAWRSRPPTRTGSTS